LAFGFRDIGGQIAVHVFFTLTTATATAATAAATLFTFTRHRFLIGRRTAFAQCDLLLRQFFRRLRVRLRR
jgi:hypothetical protein